MNREQQQIIDEVYKNYVSNYEKNEWTDEFCRQNLKDCGDQWDIFDKEEFINKCKTDPEFSERWGLKIEERIKMAWPVFFPDSKDIKMFLIGVDEDHTLHKNMDDNNIPTNKTIESYDSNR